ncbi:uncharacterized protein LOC126625507 [Malus sylvestris]|uniref:uncharacterized protein LOC126625507 n=1 Tax=Malus sylvestris TaxID=3752 RepID=UPI0021ACEE37|nr:uncharacterized protein LOC126625507 [Malus sylvestris]
MEEEPSKKLTGSTREDMNGPIFIVGTDPQVNEQPSLAASNLHKASKPYVPPVPFPSRLNKSKWDKSFAEIYDILSKVNVNLPLLDMIRNMTAYAKIFKELNNYKCKYEPHEKVMVSETVSAVLQRKLPPKLKDPGSFNINIIVGDTKLEKAMLDLGASINLIPYSIYIQLGLGELKPTTMSLQLADRSVKYPRDMEDAPIHDRELPVLLGRPFMATARQSSMFKMDRMKNKLEKTLTVAEEDENCDADIGEFKAPQPHNVAPTTPLEVSNSKAVPKKYGIASVNNDNNELVPTRVTTGWRICIDYRKLNVATRKEPFPLPFIDPIIFESDPPPEALEVVDYLDLIKP